MLISISCLKFKRMNCIKSLLFCRLLFLLIASTLSVVIGLVAYVFLFPVFRSVNLGPAVFVLGAASHQSANIWVRCDSDCFARVEYLAIDTVGDQKSSAASIKVALGSATGLDHTGIVVLGLLSPCTQYAYNVSIITLDSYDPSAPEEWQPVGQAWFRTFASEHAFACPNSNSIMLPSSPSSSSSSPSASSPSPKSSTTSLSFRFVFGSCLMPLPPLLRPDGFSFFSWIFNHLSPDAFLMLGDWAYTDVPFRYGKQKPISTKAQVLVLESVTNMKLIDVSHEGSNSCCFA